VSESGESLTLNTEHKQRSSKGGGSIDKEDDKPGVAVTCMLNKADISFFKNHYPEHIRLYLPEIMYGSRINIKRIFSLKDRQFKNRNDRKAIYKQSKANC
jgi:hypothetical protein